MGWFPGDRLERRKACVWFDENNNKLLQWGNIHHWPGSHWFPVLVWGPNFATLCRVAAMTEGNTNCLCWLKISREKWPATQWELVRLHLPEGRESDPLCWSRDRCRRPRHWWTCRWSSPPPGRSPGPTWCTWTSPRPCWCDCAPSYQPGSCCVPLSS